VCVCDHEYYNRSKSKKIIIREKEGRTDNVRP
jgi:hypothetical protein